MSTEALKTAATGKSLTPTTQLQAYFAQHKTQIEAALPKHLNADRMCRLALTAFHQNRALMECDPKTVFASVVVASQMGLEIGVAGQGYLVPYKKKCTFIPGWQGLVDLVSRAGRSTVWTGAVYDGDQFDYSLGDNPFIKHKPCGEDHPDKLIFAYAVGRVNGSDYPVIEVWPVKKLKSHRDKFNKVGSSHYSFDNWEMYARKVPLLQVIKYMPKSIEVINALTLDEAAEQGKGASIDGNFVVVDEDDDQQGSRAQAPGANTEGKPNAEQAAAAAADAAAKEKQRKAAAGNASPFEKVCALIDKAKGAKDEEVRTMGFDEARSLIKELADPEQQQAAQERLDAATGAKA